ncbi:MAG TPA: hypothetical protein VK934_13310 [Fimbriimonas sp.]|nr:hypothetical protein [Fimbriimonas sp.]
MRPRRRTKPLAANPFVAFTDVSIAVSFVFAMCSVALSKVLSDMTRDQRQMQTQRGFVSLVAHRFPGTKDEPAPWAKTTYDRKRNVILKQEGRIVGKFSSNGSYQRIELSTTYVFGSLSTKDPEAYLQIGRIVKDLASAGGIAYVFLHPIVEPGEAKAAGMASDRDLARERMDKLYALWLTNGLIAGDGESPKLSKKLDPQYVVYYGKEGLYRNSAPEDRQNRDRTPGRVDVVLFYQDVSNEPSTPVSATP